MSGTHAIPVGRYVEVCDGLRMHYHERGQASESRPTVLFLHGSGPGASGYSNFQKNMDVLGDLGWHVLVPDFPGFGLSDKPRDVAYTSAFIARAITGLLEATGVSSVVPVGNSLGGVIAFEYTFANMDKVAKLILMAPGGIIDSSEWAADMPGLKMMFELVGNRNTDRDAFRKVLHNIVADPTSVTDEIIDQRLPIWETQPPEVFSTMKTGVFGDRLHELDMPVLCFWGQKDLFLPVKHAAVIAERCKDARVVISSHAGHWFMVEEPEYFNRQIEWFLNHG